MAIFHRAALVMMPGFMSPTGCRAARRLRLTPGGLFPAPGPTGGTAGYSRSAAPSRVTIWGGGCKVRTREGCPSTLSKSVGMRSPQFRRVCDLGCPFSVVHVERVRT
jgi:hypothetical protein